MIELVALISEFGLPVIAGATVLYLLLRGEIHFSYPRGIGDCGARSPGSHPAVGASRVGSRPLTPRQQFLGRTLTASVHTHAASNRRWASASTYNFGSRLRKGAALPRATAR